MSFPEKCPGEVRIVLPSMTSAFSGAFGGYRSISSDRVRLAPGCSTANSTAWLPTRTNVFSPEIDLRMLRHTPGLPAIQDRDGLLSQLRLGTQPVQRLAMESECETLDLPLRRHVRAQAASLERSATRFIAPCSVASRPRRFRRKSVSSALTITPSKNASTGARRAASVCSEPV